MKAIGMRDQLAMRGHATTNRYWWVPLWKHLWWPSQRDSVQWRRNLLSVSEMMSFSMFWTNTGNGLWVFIQWRTHWESFHSTRSVTSNWSSSVTKLGIWLQWQQLIVPVWSYFVGATRALQNTRLTFSRSVPFTVEFRYSAAEYALAEESVK